MKNLATVLLILALPGPLFAGGYIPQASFGVSLSSIAGLDADSVGNLYALGLQSGSTSYRVASYSTPDLGALLSFDTGLSSPTAFAVEGTGVVDILDGANGFLLKRFTNVGGLVGQSTFSLGGVTPNFYSAAIDKQNRIVYVAYQYTYHPIYPQCLGCGGPSTVTRAQINQYDLQGNSLLAWSMPGADYQHGTCYTPTALAVDPQGNLLVGDAACGMILKFSGTGNQLSAVSAGSWTNNFSPRSLWTDVGSNVYVSLPGTVAKLGSDGSYQTSFAADAASGQAWDGRILYLIAPSPRVRRFVFDGPPTVPAESAPLGMVVQHSSAAVLSWQAANDPDSDPLLYTVYLGTAPGQLSPAGSTDQASFTTSPLAFGVTYYWQVVGQDSYRGLPLLQTQAPVVGFNLNLLNRAPGAFNVLSGAGTAVTRTPSVQLAWQGAADPDGDSVAYDLFWSTSPALGAPALTTMDTARSFSGLAYGATYYWSVRARDGYGAATWLSGGTPQTFTLVFKNSPPTAPSLQTTASAYSLHTSTPAIALSWLPSTDPDGDPVTYTFAITSGSAPPVQTALGSAISTTVPVAFGTSYAWQVLAADPYGGVLPSPWQSFVATFANQPPNPIVYLSTITTLSTRAAAYSLSWQDSGDPDGDAVVYGLYLSTSPNHQALIQQGAQTGYSLALQYGTTFYWRVTATDSFGAVTTGALQSFLPIFRNSPPSPPTNFSKIGTVAYHGFSPSQTFTWGSSLDPDGDAVSYQLYLGTAAVSTLPVATVPGYTTPLALNATYYYKVLASDPYGASSNSAINSVFYQLANTPPQPFAVLGGSGTISTRSTADLLAWTAAIDPDGDPVSYRVYFGTSAAASPSVADTLQQTLAVGPLAFGVAYFWRVEAYDGFGGTTPINGGTQSLSHVFANSPPAPIVYLSTAGAYSLHTASPNITLSWAPSADPDGDLVSYQLQVQTSTGLWPPVALGAATSLTLGLQLETTYFWRVTAADSYGGASTGAWLSFVVHLANQAPFPIVYATTGTLVTRATSTSLAWQNTGDPDGDLVVYSLYLSTSPQVQPLVQQGAQTSFPLSFQFGTTCYWSVSATDAFGTRTDGPLQTFLPVFRNSPPGVPANLSKTGTIAFHGTAPSLSFFWQSALEPDGDAVSYQVFLGTDPAALAQIPGATLGSTASNLALNTAYYYRIVAVDPYGAASASPTNWVYFQFVNNPPGPFDVVGTTGTISTRQTSAALSWTPSADPDGDPVSYMVLVGTAPSALNLLANTTRTSAPVPTLAFGTTYYWRVDAYDGFGATTTANEGLQSLVCLFYDPPLSPLVYLSTTASYSQHTSSPSVVLAWTPSANAAGDPIAYRLDMQTSTGAWPSLSMGAATSLALSPVFETTYTWRVVAVDPYGGASTGSWLSFAAHLANQPPSAIQYLTPPTLSTRAASYPLAWVNTGDPDGDPVVYSLDLGNSIGALATVQASSSTAFPLPLQYGATIYYRVTATDSFGSAAAGPLQSFYSTFLNDPPQAPNVVSPFTQSPTVKTMRNSVEVSWQQVSDPQGDPITYTVYLGNSAGDMSTLATISQAAQSGTTSLALRPAAARPHSQVQLDGNTVTLSLTGLDYYKNYYLRVAASNPYGATTTAPVQTFTLASADGFPKAYNYPNPFSPLRGGTYIVFNAPPSGYAKATVEVYSELQDLLFKQDYLNIPPGISQVHFDGRDRNGRAFFNGSYIARVRFSGPEDKQVFYLLVVK